MSDQTKSTPLAAPAAGARFQYGVKCITGGWDGRCILLQEETMSPLSTNDPSAGTLPLVFETANDAERFKEGLAQNMADFLVQSSGMDFDEALAFAKSESTDKLIIAIPDGTVMSPEENVYLVTF